MNKLLVIILFLMLLLGIGYFLETSNHLISKTFFSFMARQGAEDTLKGAGYTDEQIDNAMNKGSDLGTPQNDNATELVKQRIKQTELVTKNVCRHIATFSGTIPDFDPKTDASTQNLISQAKIEGLSAKNLGSNLVVLNYTSGTTSCDFTCRTNNSSEVVITGNNCN